MPYFIFPTTPREGGGACEKPNFSHLFFIGRKTHFFPIPGVGFTDALPLIYHIKENIMRFPMMPHMPLNSISSPGGNHFMVGATVCTPPLGTLCARGPILVPLLRAHPMGWG